MLDVSDCPLIWVYYKKIYLRYQIMKKKKKVGSFAKYSISDKGSVSKNSRETLDYSIVGFVPINVIYNSFISFICLV